MGSITFFLLWSGLNAVSLGCKCAIPAAEEKFEKADFVWKVKITTDLENIVPPSFDNSTYGYTLKKIYNNDNDKGCFPLNPSKINTATQSATCGVDWLEKGKKYIISGKWTGEKLLINNCNSLVFDLTNRTQRKEWKAMKRSVRARKFICRRRG